MELYGSLFVNLIGDIPSSGGAASPSPEAGMLLPTPSASLLPAGSVQGCLSIPGHARASQDMPG